HNSRFSESGQAGLLISGGLGIITDCKIVNNYVGVEIKENGAPTIQHCQINANRSQGLLAESASAGSITSSDLSRNSGGPWKIETASQLARKQNVEEGTVSEPRQGYGALGIARGSIASAR